VSSPTPAKPSRNNTFKLVNIRLETGCQAVFGTKNDPYITEDIAMRLIEIALEIGAPIKPKAKGFGPKLCLTLGAETRKIGENEDQASS